MSEINKDDLFYLCTMIEYVARKTKNRTADIVESISDKELEHQLKAASVNHCLPFEQVCDEWIEEYNIIGGNYDNISICRYEVPTVTAIGRVYQTLIMDIVEICAGVVDAIRSVYSSFISDEISDFNTSVYYSNPDYLKWSYMEGKLLD